MCEQCLVAPVYFGEPLPGWRLARARAEHPDARWRQGEWALIRRNDPVFRWRSTPVPGPDRGLTEAGADALYDTLEPGSVEFRRVFDAEEECADFFGAFDRCGVEDGYELIAAARTCGYETGTRFAPWFFDHLGDYLTHARADYDYDHAWFRERIGLPVDESIGAAPLPGEPYYRPSAQSAGETAPGSPAPE